MPAGRIYSSSFRHVCCGYHRRLTPLARRAYSATPSNDIYDVVCVGGGPAGLSLLTALRSARETSHLRLALVEAQDLSKVTSFSLPATQYSNRCSSLTPSSLQFLDDIGAAAHMQTGRVQAFREMQVWEALTGARITFEHEHEHAPGHGGTVAYMTENLNTTSGLMKRLRQLGDVAVLDRSRVETITLGTETDDLDLSGWPVVHLSGGRSLAARLLVGADGANSPVRTFAGIESRGWNYDQHAVVATLETEGLGWGGEAHKIAYQRFLPTGPVAVLPMPGRHATLVWSTTPDRAAVLHKVSPRGFLALVNAAFRLSVADIAYMHDMTRREGVTLGARPPPDPKDHQEELEWRLRHTSFDETAVPQPVVGLQEGSVASFPLRLRHADTYVGERVALVGDAAHTVHPLAGQGLNLGLGDVSSLARTIRSAVRDGLDLGVRTSLEPYNSERYAYNHVVINTCDKLQKLYSVESGPLVPLRSIALSAINSLTSIKGLLMDQAAGGIKPSKMRPIP